MESHHLVMLSGQWSSANGDIKYLLCHVKWQKHVIEASSNFIVAIGIVVVEI